MMTKAFIFVLSLFLAANSQSPRRNGKISAECVNGPGWTSDLTAEAGIGPRYIFHNRDLPPTLIYLYASYTFAYILFTTGIYLLTLTGIFSPGRIWCKGHLILQQCIAMSLTYFHHHQFPSPIPSLYLPGRNV